MADYICEGCGLHVSVYGLDKPPPEHFCMTCGFVHFAVKDDMKIVQELLVHLGQMKPL